MTMKEVLIFGLKCMILIKRLNFSRLSFKYKVERDALHIYYNIAKDSYNYFCYTFYFAN